MRLQQRLTGKTRNFSVCAAGKFFQAVRISVAMSAGSERK
jgi:hypothetical protein